MTELLSFSDVVVPLRGQIRGGPWTFSLPTGTGAALRASPSVADAVARLCAGALAPEKGTVLVLGQCPYHLPRNDRNRLLRRVGISFQREGLVSNLSLEDNLTVPMLFGGHCSPTEARTRASQAMVELGLDAYRALRPGALARETRILAVLARAALRGPELMILEHLSSGLGDRLARRALSWCRDRCRSMLVLVPGPSAVLDDLAFEWLSPISVEEGEVGRE